MNVINQLLVKKILEKATAFEWSVQGLGMFRMYLSKEVRLHVWDPRVTVKDVTTIHSHPWDFASEVISGWIHDEVYKVEPEETLECRRSLNYFQQCIVCGPGGGVSGKPEVVSLRFERQRIVEVGGVYNLFHDEVHKSTADPGTVTIITRHFRQDTEHANVYHKVGTPWISAEPRAATRDEVEAMSKLALERMK